MDDKQVKLSILIPVYNGEQYLERCINSILQQACDFEIEILIVNDGLSFSNNI